MGGAGREEGPEPTHTHPQVGNQTTTIKQEAPQPDESLPSTLDRPRHHLVETFVPGRSLSHSGSAQEDPLHSCCWSLSVPARWAFRFCCSLACFEAGLNGGCLPSHAGALTSSAGRRRNNETLERRATKPSITLSWVRRCCCSLQKEEKIYLCVCSSPWC